MKSSETKIVKADGTSFDEAIAKTGGFGWFQTKLLLISLPIALSFSIGVSSVSFVMPAMFCEFSITKYQQGLIYSAIYMGMVPFGPLWGGAADLFGRRITLIITSAIAGVFEFLASFSTGFWMLFTCKVLAGCATSGIHLTFYIYMSEFVDARDKDTMTVKSGGIAAVGYLVLPLLAAFLIPLQFQYVLIPDVVVINSWKLFIMIASLAPVFGFLVSVFFLTETPKYLLMQNRQDESLKILQQIYGENTKQPMDTFPIKSLSTEDKLDVKKETSGDVSKLTKLVNYVKPLFQYPYFIPAMMAFAAQLITMGSYNTVRQHMPTLFTLALGIGQHAAGENTTEFKNPENVEFCVLFESQAVFAKKVNCDQSDIHLDRRIFFCSAFVGLMIFVSFFFTKIAVKKVGKVATFIIAHLVSAAAVAYFPFSNALGAVAIMTIYSVCMQNCLTIALGLMIGRVPASMRGLTVSLIMVIGRIGVILGNQVLPIITNISCYFGFWTIACMNLKAIPIMWVYSRQPNPYEDATLLASGEKK